MRVAIGSLLLLTFATPALAQSPAYIGVSLVGEIVRASRIHIDLTSELLQPDLSPDGEALAGAIVAGTALGDRWGIELEFVRPGVIERSRTDVIRRGIPTLPGVFPVPSFEFSTEIRLRNTTLSAEAWIRQDLSERLQLVYLGGITFARSETERRTGLVRADILPGIPIPIPIPTGRTKITEHRAGPVVGVDARWKLGEHVAVVPGIRLHSLWTGGRPGWLIRPSIGIRWQF